MNFSCIFFGIVFLGAGLLFALGKIHPRLSAWRTMPEEEKRKINIVPLTRNIGAVIMLCGIIFLLSGLIPAFSGRPFVGAMAAWLVLAGLDLRHISKSSRYQSP